MKAHAKNHRPICCVIPLALVGGCSVSDPDTVVELRNATDRVVSVHLFYGDEQAATEGLLEATGEEVNVDVAAGETVVIADACTELQAIFIEEAKLDLALGAGPTDDTRVYRDGMDFGCGDTIRFTFTSNVLETDLDTSFAQNP